MLLHLGIRHMSHLAEATIMIGIEGRKDLLNLPVSQMKPIHQGHLTSAGVRRENDSSEMAFPP